MVCSSKFPLNHPYDSSIGLGISVGIPFIVQLDLGQPPQGPTAGCGNSCTKAALFSLVAQPWDDDPEMTAFFGRNHHCKTMANS